MTKPNFFCTFNIFRRLKELRKENEQQKSDFMVLIEFLIDFFLLVLILVTSITEHITEIYECVGRVVCSQAKPNQRRERLRRWAIESTADVKGIKKFLYLLILILCSFFISS